MVQNFSKGVTELMNLIGDAPLSKQWVGEGSALDRKLKFQPKPNQHLICQVLEPIAEEESSDTSTNTQ